MDWDKPNLRELGKHNNLREGNIERVTGTCPVT